VLVDPRDCQRVASEQRLLPLRASSPEHCDHHFNIDGLVITALQIKDRFVGYLQPILHAMWQAGGHASCPRYHGGTYDRNYELQ